MIKKLFSIILCLVCMSGCQKHVDKNIKAELINKAEDIMQKMQNHQYEKVIEQGATIFRIQVSAKQLESGWNSIPDVYGKYLGIDRAIITELAPNGYRIVIVVNFEKYKAQYTMAFDDELKLIGIFFK